MRAQWLCQIAIYPSAKLDIRATTMASPTAQQPNGHPSPPTQPEAEPALTQTQTRTQAQPAAAANAANATSSNPKAPAAPTTNPDVPLTSLTEDGTSKRPRDARLLHLVLSAQGIQSYQERVPLQLLDFAYRYTSSVLGDALRLAGEGYTGAGDNARGGGAAGRGRGGGGAGGEGGEGSIGVTALRQAIASRQDFGFQGGYLPKEFMLEQAGERNRVALPRVERAGAVGGLVLPEEKYCLTGSGWGLKETWEDEESEGDEEGAAGQGKEVSMGGMEEGEGQGDEDEEGVGRMEDVFGEDAGGGGEDGDVDMGGD